MVAFRNMPAVWGNHRVDARHVGGHASDVGVVEAVRAGAHFAVNAQLHADAERQLHIVAQSFEVVPSDLFVAAISLHVLFDVGDDGKTREQKDVGAQVGDAVGDVTVYAGDQGNDHDEGGDRKNDAQQHQEGAHFVGAQSLQGHTDRFSEQNPPFHACDSLVHSTHK